MTGWRQLVPWWVLVAALLALIPAVAMLQYQWLGQLSEAESMRLHANLQSATKQFESEFDRELTRLFLVFGSFEFQQSSLEESEHRWNINASYP